MRDVIRQKLADALVFEPPELTWRDLLLPGIARRAQAITSRTDPSAQRRPSALRLVMAPGE